MLRGFKYYFLKTGNKKLFMLVPILEKCNVQGSITGQLISFGFTLTI